ncbi:unnamed protein product [Rotaria magnacalcarata]|uniref:ADP-ribosylation factor n=1 Tax=Rotaria magnacalcarata TaxID=392030 RepID=A0A820I5T1_9BILA|nr:unnamed protein product [Rotaria magnacalcarata]CAF1584846.1 unnamed protein product [Rotaria magnacalcarata]CAF2042725.1 unnamed protein product [Rotaria magnacalcarata]CAF2155480.1 unnamed protein product [Rotaria magnacalcarata]CAF2238461.1 unnamed protein product [Rotaria magnacalcarata]
MGSSFNKMSSYFFQKEEARVLMQGLDAAGKTTVLYVMKLGEVVTTIPTIGFNVETVEFKNISITAWDVGGRDKIRPLWRHYYQNTRAIVFVVDSNDRDRVDDASRELHTMANEDELRNIPILILANKQDLPNAMSIVELRDKLALNKFTGDRKWHIQGTVATEKKGLREGFDWLADALTTKNVNIFQPLVETTNDSKIIKDNLISIFHSIDLKSTLAKFFHY